jgi:hypothetical protein
MVKVRDLTADASPTGDDLLHGTNNPGGTPGSRKWTLDNTLNYLLTRTQTWTGVNSFSDNIQLSATKKLFLDGGIDTSIRESAANVITFEIGGGDDFQLTSSAVNMFNNARIDINANNGVLSIQSPEVLNNHSGIYFNTSGTTLGFSSTISYGGIKAVQTQVTPSTLKSALSLFTNSGDLLRAGLTVSDNRDIVVGTTKRIYFDGGISETELMTGGNTYMVESAADQLEITVGGENGLRLHETGTEVNVVCGAANALATTAVDGFLYIPSMAGAPTGNSTDYTGKFPIVWDSTNKNLMINTATTTWEKIGSTPKGISVATYYDDTASLTTQLFIPPVGYATGGTGNGGINDSGTESQSSFPLSSSAITVTRVRIRIYDNPSTSAAGVQGLRNATDNNWIHQFTSVASANNTELDSGAISVSVDASDELAWSLQWSGTPSGGAEVLYIVEYEYN